MIRNKTHTAIISLDEDNVLLVKVKDGVEVDKEELINLVETSLEIVEGNSFYLLVDARNIFSSIDHESRDHFAKHKEYNRLNIAQAIVVNNAPTKLIANFYFRFYKHENPVKVFTDIDKGRKWLLTN